jgi:hypothetical protein
MKYCVGDIDAALCDLATSLNIASSLSASLVSQPDIVVESNHPITDGDYLFEIQGENVVYYSVSFDARTFLVGFMEFFSDKLFVNSIQSFSNGQAWPGTGNTPPLFIYMPVFYIKINSYNADSFPSWGIKISISPSSSGMGWKCTETSSNARSLAASTVSLYAESYCSWTGVSCLFNTTVVGLDLSGFGLVGQQIPSTIGALNKITKLNLASNKISGSIPSSLGDLSFLQIIDLSGNSLFGSVPVEVSALSVLVSFSFYSLTID